MMYAVLLLWATGSIVNLVAYASTWNNERLIVGLLCLVMFTLTAKEVKP